jgi:uncharacterized phage protein (TIGR02220 family)
MNELSLTARPIPYNKAYRQIAGSVTATILMQQLEYWFEKMHGPFFKFLEPVEGEKFGYKNGDSWTESLGFSAAEFRTAFKRIGIIYTSKKQYDAVEDKFQGKMYCSYYDKVARKTWYFRDPEKVDANLRSLRSLISRDQQPQSLETKDVNLERAETTQETTTETTTNITDKTKEMQQEKTSKMAASPLVTNSLDESADQVIDYLNSLAGTRYQHSKASRKFIRARIREGATIEDCKLIIEHKVSKWLFDPEMAEYLRPTTLFRPSHFEEYLAASIRWHETGCPLTEEAEKQKARFRDRAVIAEAEKRGLRRTGIDGKSLPEGSAMNTILDAIGGGFGY